MTRPHDPQSVARPTVGSLNNELPDHADKIWMGTHGPGPDQCGANCNWAQNYTTDAYHHGLEHPLSLVGEVASFLKRG